MKITPTERKKRRAEQALESYYRNKVVNKDTPEIMARRNEVKKAWKKKADETPELRERRLAARRANNLKHVEQRRAYRKKVAEAKKSAPKTIDSHQ